MNVPVLRSLPPFVVRIAQVVVLGALGWQIWKVVDGEEAIAVLANADPSWLFAAAVMLTLQTLLSAQRWRITAERLGINISRGQAIREYYLAQVVNQSLPGGMIGDAGRAVRFRKEAGLLSSGQAVIFERLSGQIGMLLLLVSGLVLATVVPTGFRWPEWLVSSIGVSLGILVAVLVGTFLLLRLRFKSVEALRRFVSAFAHSVTAPGILAHQTGLSVGTALCNVLAFAFCAAALGIILPKLVVLTLVPLSIGGWGFREGAAVLLFPVMGATPGQGLATSVAFGLMFLLAVLPGAVMTRFGKN